MTSHFINTYATSINSVIAKLSFIHINILATLLYYSGPRMLARSERTSAPRYRDLRVGVDPAGLYQIRLVRWGAGESPLGEPPLWDVLPGLRLPLARGGLY